MASLESSVSQAAKCIGEQEQGKLMSLPQEEQQSPVLHSWHTQN